jgi:hypothetical protein
MAVRTGSQTTTSRVRISGSFSPRRHCAWPARRKHVGRNPEAPLRVLWFSYDFAQQAAFIKAGVDPGQVAGAVAQIEAEIAAKDKRRADISRYLAETADRREQMTSLDSLASRAAGRLGSMTLAEQREVLDLLNVRVEVLDNTKSPALRITGTVADFGATT